MEKNRFRAQTTTRSSSILHGIVCDFSLDIHASRIEVTKISISFEPNGVSTAYINELHNATLSYDSLDAFLSEWTGIMQIQEDEKVVAHVNGSDLDSRFLPESRPENNPLDAAIIGNIYMDLVLRDETLLQDKDRLKKSVSDIFYTMKELQIELCS